MNKQSEAEANFTQAWTNLLESFVKTFKIIEILDWMGYWLGKMKFPSRHNKSTNKTNDEFYKEYKLMNNFDLSLAYMKTLKIIKIK